MRDRDERTTRSSGAPKRAGGPGAAKRKGKPAVSTKDKGKPRWASKGSGGKDGRRG